MWNRRPWVERALVGALSATAALAAAELGLRVLHWRSGTFEVSPMARWVRTNSKLLHEDPELLYVYRPDVFRGGVRLTNTAGMVQPDDVPLAAEPGTSRAALVGDSLSAGAYLPAEQRLHACLERALAVTSPGLRVRVLNFGVQGYSADQEARALEVRVLPFHPDLILLQFCLNDAGISLTPAGHFIDPEEPALHLLDLAGRKLLGWRDAIDRLAVPRFGPGHPDDRFWAGLYAPDSDSWQGFVAAYERIDRLARAAGIPVVLAVFPLYLDSSYPAGALRPYHERVAELGASLGWTVIDLLETFAAHPVGAVRKAPDDVYHHNGFGNEIAAERLAPVLARMLSGRRGR